MTSKIKTMYVKKQLNILIKWIAFQYNSIWNTVHWNRMIFKANFKKWCSRNEYEIFFVLPFTKISLGIINAQQRQDYNKQCMKQGLRRLSHNNLIKSCYYCTGKIITLK